MRRTITGALLVCLLCGFRPAGRECGREMRGSITARGNDPAYEEAREIGIARLFRSAAGLTPDERRLAAAAVVREARAAGLDPLLIASVIAVESSFRGQARSPAGALGLMQVMPATGAWFGARIGVPVNDPHDLLDPERNIRIGVRYLAYLLARFERLDHALVAYNAGPARARRVLRGPAAEMWLSRYPRQVLREHRRLHAELARR